MTTQRFKRMAVALGAATFFVGAPALADTLRYDGAWFGSYYGSFTLHDSTPTALTLGASSGAFRMTPTMPAGNSFMAWCVDIYHRLNTGSSTYVSTDGASFLGGAVTERLERLASYVVSNDANPGSNTLQSALSGSFQSAAFQLAVWEIVNEGVATTLNVNSGDFYVTGNMSTLSVRDLANDWLAESAGWARSQVLNVWAGPNTTQDLAVFAPIPEPETYAMILAGLGLMGFIARRRRAAAA